MTSRLLVTPLVLATALTLTTIGPAAAETGPENVVVKRPTPIGDTVAAYAAQQRTIVPTLNDPWRFGSGHHAPRLLPILIGAGIGFGLGAGLVHLVPDGGSGTEMIKVGAGLGVVGAGMGYVISMR